MRVCVTGAAGFVGTSLVDLLLSKGCHVTALVHNRLLPESLTRRRGLECYICDLRDLSDLSGFMKGADCLIHNAIVWDDLDTGPNTIDTFVSINLFQWATAQGVEQIIYTSTTAVHRPFKPLMTEDDVLQPDDDYADIKLKGELALKDFAESAGVKTTIIRSAPVIGAPEYEGEQLKLLSGLKSIFDSALDNAPIYLPKEPGRQFICRRDLAETFWQAMQPKSPAGTFLAASANMTSWEQVARQFVEQLDSKSEIIPPGQYSPPSFFDCSRLAKEFGLTFDSQLSLQAMIESLTNEYTKGPFSQ